MRSVACLRDRAVAIDALDLDGGAHFLCSLCCRATSCTKWQSMQCMPFSRWMSIRCTGTPSRLGFRWSRSPGLLRGGIVAILLLQIVAAWPRALSMSGSASVDDAAVVVEQVALAILLEDGAEDPAVAVEVGELGVLGLRVEVGDVVEELRIGPVAAGGGLIGVGHLVAATNSSAVGCFLLRGGYISSPSVSSSHHM